MKFEKLAQLYKQFEKIRGHALRNSLASFFKTVPAGEIDIVTILTTGRIAPEHFDINMGMADKMIIKAIERVSKKQLIHEYKKSGDVGLVAEHNVGRKKRQLSVQEVYKTLHNIAQSAGEGSQEKKINLLARLLSDASPLEARYIARLALGKLRLGLGDQTIIDALAIAYNAKKEILEHAYNTSPDIGHIAKTLVTKGTKGLLRIDILINRPVQMMLAQRVKHIEEIIKKSGLPVTVEEKYDGERVQAHSSKDIITLYSRRLENITRQYPDVILALKKSVKAKNYIVEGEIVPVDKTGRLLPFQTLMQRRRKYDVESYAKKVPIQLYLFDLLYFKKSYLHQAYPQRRNVLEKITKENKTIKLARQTIAKNLNDVQQFFKQALQRGCEGIIAKSRTKDSRYTPGKRGWNWIKWKKEYAKGLADTYDLVVVGAFSGRGRRSGTYGALLCAVYDEKNNRYLTFCKLGSGFSDKDLKQLPKKFPPTKNKADNVIIKGLTPDYWTAPSIVIEVLGAEITKSPQHSSGYALRFPRFVRYRPDKKPQQATTIKEIQAYVKKTA